MKRRVAVLVHGGLEPEGVGVYVPFLVECLTKLSSEWEMEVFTFASRSNRRRESCAEMPVHFVNRTDDQAPTTKYLRLFEAVREVHSRNPFALVHAVWLYPSGIVAMALRMMRRCPVVLSLHGAETACIPAEGYGYLRNPYRRVTIYCCRKADVLTVLSRHQVGVLVGHGVKRDDIIVVPPGVNLQRFAFTDREVHQPLRLLHVANLTEIKDQETLLQAFRLVRCSLEAELRIVGADYLNGAIQRRAREMELSAHISFLGYVAHDEMPQHYRWADILLATSKHEAGGVAVSEAMFSGAIVCGTRAGIVADLDGDAVMGVSIADAEALAAAALEVVSVPELARDLRVRARTWAERNSIEQSVERFNDAYRYALGSTAGMMHHRDH